MAGVTGRAPRSRRSAPSLGETPQAGWRAGGRAWLQHDTRDYLFDPWTRRRRPPPAPATRFTALERASGCRRSRRAAMLLRLFELAPGHVLALAGEGSATCGDIRLFAQLTSAGGPLALRGYGADELLARSRALGRIELRDDYWTGLDWNLLHFTTVRGFAGTLFADVGRDRHLRDLRALARSRLLRRRLQLPRPPRRVRPPPAAAVDRLRRAAQPPRPVRDRASACRAPPPTARPSSSWSASSPVSDDDVVTVAVGSQACCTIAVRVRLGGARLPPVRAQRQQEHRRDAIVSDRCAAIRRGRGSSPAATSASAASTTTASGASAHGPGRCSSQPEPVRRVALADQRERQIEDRVVERLRIVRVERARNDVEQHRRDQQPDGDRGRPPARRPRAATACSSGNSRNGATVAM